MKFDSAWKTMIILWVIGAVVGFAFWGGLIWLAIYLFHTYA